MKGGFYYKRWTKDNEGEKVMEVDLNALFNATILDNKVNDGGGATTARKTGTREVERYPHDLNVLWTSVVLSEIGSFKGCSGG